MHRIEFTPEAGDDLASLRKYDQSRVVAEIEIQLLHEPTRETCNQKRLRPNQTGGVGASYRDVPSLLRRPSPRTRSSRSLRSATRTGNDLYIHGEKYDLS